MGEELRCGGTRSSVTTLQWQARLADSPTSAATRASSGGVGTYFEREQDRPSVVAAMQRAVELQRLEVFHALSEISGESRSSGLCASFSDTFR